ncbi:MAG: hypothetical protein IJ252_09320 [Solobacterium sp.]|nr:hypothetical protein [Solobacterium sp.]
MDNDVISTMNDSAAEMEYISTHIKFVKAFGHGVPTEMIPSYISKKEIISAMKQCLDEGEDRILEILNVEINHDVLY